MAEEQKRITYTTSLNPDIIKRFKIYCALRGLYQNQVLEQLLLELLDKEGEEIGNSN